MKHGFTFRLICLLIALATLPARSVAQTYEYVDDEGVHHVVHVVERDSDEDEVREYDTIRWRHNLRLTFGTLRPYSYRKPPFNLSQLLLSLSVGMMERLAFHFVLL